MIVSKQAIEKLMIHHSLTADGQTVSWQAIRRFHMETQKWLDIGYHFGIELVGDEYEVLVGRPENRVAAACKEGEMNSRAIHICCVGNFDLAPPSPPLIDRLLTYAIMPILQRYHLGVNQIVGHRDYAHYKSCPGRLFDLDMLRSEVWKRLGVNK